MRNLDECDDVIETILRSAKIPGAALAVIVGRETVFSRAYGYRDLRAKLPMTVQTVYPIASASKAINATLIGMLVDERKLDWDIPVQHVLPRFKLCDPAISSRVTLRDLVAMRTGLPRHDWMWMANPISRAELVERLPHLELSAGFRERFQYNNLTVSISGHIAEVIAGEPWEELARKRILDPLGMTATTLALPESGEITLSYHENSLRELAATPRFNAGPTAPSSGAIHSTVQDMSSWIAFNLAGGTLDGGPLVKPGTLKDIHSPWMVVGAAPESVSPNCAYGGGWFIDTYNGRDRVSHGGYLYDVNSDVALFPGEGIGVVSFTNFGFPRFARFINEHVFDLIMGIDPVQTLEAKLAQNVKKQEQNRALRAAAQRVAGTSPSHPASDYAGIYSHPAYGTLRIHVQREELVLEFNQLLLPLAHWHYDVWFAKETDVIAIHEPHLFDRANRLAFETDADGVISAVTVCLEPAIAPIRFGKGRKSC